MRLVRFARAAAFTAWSLGVAATPTPAQKATTALADARTVFIVNGTGDRYTIDPIVKELRGWKRFTISESRDSADLIVTLGLANVDASLGIPIASAETRAPKTLFTLTVQDRASERTVWSDNQERGLRAGAALTKLTRRFKQYVEKQRK